MQTWVFCGNSPNISVISRKPTEFIRYATADMSCANYSLHDLIHYIESSEISVRLYFIYRVLVVYIDRHCCEKERNGFAVAVIKVTVY